MQERQWITARRSELDALAEELAKQLQEVQAERDELAIAERVLSRLAEQARADAGAVAPLSAKVAGRAVLLTPHRSDAADEGALPGDYRKILAIARVAEGPVRVRAVGERLGLDASVRGKLECVDDRYCGATPLRSRSWYTAKTSAGVARPTQCSRAAGSGDGESSRVHRERADTAPVRVELAPHLLHGVQADGSVGHGVLRMALGQDAFELREFGRGP